MMFSCKTKYLCLSIMCFTASLFCAMAQDFTSVDTLKFYNALDFKLINKGFHDSETPYFRIPATIKDSVNTTLYERSKCTAGEGIRFRTNSHCVAVRYRLLTNMHMAHMADTGIKGADLYILDEGKWRFLNCNRPCKDSVQCKVYIDKLDGTMHEFMLYLPLYDGVNRMEIGIEKDAVIEMPKINNPRQEISFVFYGTSIMQGGCATRPGMAATNILQRELNAECVNLGISGEGKMVSALAHAMAKISSVKAFIIDPVPNCTKLQCDTLTYNFIKILREARPEVPIFMVEGLMYSYAKYSSYYNKYLRQKNYEFHKNYLKLKAEDARNLYYIDCKNIYGPDNEGTVDGIHLTDVGFYWYAQKLKPYLQAILNGAKVPFQEKVDLPYPEIPNPDDYTWTK